MIEAAEDWCETDANWQDIQYRWTINSFSKCQEELGNYVTSPEFPSALMAGGGDVADRSLGAVGRGIGIGEGGYGRGDGSGRRGYFDVVYDLACLLNHFCT